MFVPKRGGGLLKSERHVRRKQRRVIEVGALFDEDPVVEGALTAVGALLGKRVVSASLAQGAFDGPA